VTIRTAARCALLSGLLLVTACTPAGVAKSTRARAGDGGRLVLAAASSCDELMTGLHEAIRPYVAMLGGGARTDAAGPPATAPNAAAPGAGSAKDDAPPAPVHSDTNVAEVGVDEPDLVKTDGRRIVTVSRGVLWVVDAASRQLTGTLALESAAAPTNLLLFDDKALVFLPWGTAGGIAGPRLVLVDLSSGAPTVASGFVIDGQLVDARQVGGTVRVVTRSAPRLRYLPGQDPRAAVGRAGPDQWLPRYQVNAHGRTETGRVECASVRRPAQYTGSSLLTLLTFDLSQPALSDGDPVTIVADADTVYSTADSLYVLANNQWFARPQVQQTDVYKFTTSGTATPAYVASATVPGYLLNQYSVSDWHGDLRIATTVNQSTSTVYVLRPDGDQLAEVGRVGGLGHGQKIYAVRYAGPVGYVVTFRQTDPLYTLDLADPEHPRVTGALEIDGYSAYLHPVGDGRLLGVGQTSDPATGRNQGLAVSLFDVSDPTRPTRLSRFELLGAGHSIAEFNPHAFLYWPASRLAVVPIRQGAVALRVSDRTVDRAGQLTPRSGQLTRSLVVGTTLWTVSTDGLAAADLTSLTPQFWLSF
jgi:uncharacterized secreted protein with C-terminal beta-propeller domain